jgi:hypothetical protein
VVFVVSGSSSQNLTGPEYVWSPVVLKIREREEEEENVEQKTFS